jgi:hypothetical protein
MSIYTALYASTMQLSTIQPKVEMDTDRCKNVDKPCGS